MDQEDCAVILAAGQGSRLKPYTTVLPKPLHPVVDRLPESFLVMNGDVLTDIDYRRCLEARRASGCHLTVGVFKRRIQIADGVIEVGSDGRVTSFREKPTRSFWVSMGVYAMNRSVLEFVPRNRPFGMDDVVSAMLGADAPINTYRHSGEWYDIGCPEDLDRANAAFAERRARFLRPEHETVGVASWHDS